MSRVDEESGWIYFTAGERSPIATDWLRVRIDGSEQQRLTSREGSHRIDFAPKGNLAVDSWSSFESAGDIQLINTDGQKVRTIDSRPSYVLEEFKLGEFRHVQIPAEDGFLLEGTLTFPPDFDESKRYPVWLTTYAGPHAPVVRNAGGPQMRPQMLANLGIIVFQLDPRSASGKGAQSTWTAYRQLGVPELEDIECGVGWLDEASVRRREAHRHAGPQLRRVHDRLRDDPQQAVRRGHRRVAGHRLAQLRLDLHRALHEHAAGEPGRLRKDVRRQGGRQPARPAAARCTA